jgi:glutathione synthase/RimK-type ligase-like ATP-grasp enzyme
LNSSVAVVKTGFGSAGVSTFLVEKLERPLVEMREKLERPLLEMKEKLEHLCYQQN